MPLVGLNAEESLVNFDDYYGEAESPPVENVRPLQPITETSDEMSRLLSQVEGGVRKMRESAAPYLNNMAELQRQRDITIFVFRFRGILFEFSKNEVREAFLGGAFEVHPHNEEVLATIDLLRSSFALPMAPHNEIRILEFLSKFIPDNSSVEPLFNDQPLPYRLTFSKWHDFFQALWVSPGWDAALRGVLGRGGAAMPQLVGLAQAPGSQSAVRCAGTESGFNDLKVEQGPGNFALGAAGPTGGRSFEFPQSAGPSGGRSADYAFRPAGGPSGVDALADAIRNLSLPKEIIKPQIFDLSSPLTLMEFLGDFSRYFSRNFDGTAREKSILLRKFLNGSIRDAYDAFDGPLLTYEALASKLLDWYDSVKPDHLEAAREEFRCAQMKPGEDCQLYCVRLESLARRAFGNSDDSNSRLVRKLRETAPPSLLEQLNNTVTCMAALNTPTVTWNAVKRIVNAHDRQYKSQSGNAVVPVRQENDVSLYFGVPTQETPPRPQHRGSPRVFRRGFGGNRGGQQTRNFQQDSSVRPRQGGSAQGSGGNSNSPNLWCHWCGRGRHTVETCWERLGACLKCGDLSHRTENCPTVSLQQLHCPVCGGRHLGRDCNTFSDRSGNSRLGLNDRRERANSNAQSKPPLN